MTHLRHAPGERTMHLRHAPIVQPQSRTNVIVIQDTTVTRVITTKTLPMIEACSELERNFIAYAPKDVNIIDIVQIVQDISSLSFLYGASFKTANK